MVPRRGEVSKLTVRDSSAMAEYWSATMTWRNTRRTKKMATRMAKAASTIFARSDTDAPTRAAARDRPD